MNSFLRLTLLASLCYGAIAFIAAKEAISIDTARAGSLPEIQYPSDYRKWVFLSSGMDMSYSTTAPPDHHMFDNVFVNPEAYEAFLKTGTWPDKTTLVLEVRGSHEKGSINKRGAYQGDVMAIEVHARDDARFPGHWGFFQFNGTKNASMMPQTAECYSCHAEHGAVNTTFVQFYPTMLPIATEKGTLDKAYTAE